MKKKKNQEISLFAENINFNGLFLNIDYNIINENKRIDKYGGTKENKIRLILEIIKSIQDKVKNTFLLYLNINILNFNIEDLIDFINIIEQNANIYAIELNFNINTIIDYYKNIIYNLFNKKIPLIFTLDENNTFFVKQNADIMNEIKNKNIFFAVHIKSNIYNNEIQPPFHPLYQKNTKGKFIYIRHGQTEMNRKIEILGTSKTERIKSENINSGLTREAIIETKLNQKFYNNMDIEQIYVSPFKRALQTSYYLFENHPQRNNFTIIVHPLIAEVVCSVHDYILEIQSYKKKYNMNSKLKYDWSLFDSFYKTKESQDLFFLSFMDVFNDTIKNEYLTKIKKIYNEGNQTKLGIILEDITKLSMKLNLNRLESYKHAFYRQLTFKNYLSNKYKNSLQDKNKKVIIVTHSHYCQIATSKLAYTMPTIDNLPSDNNYMVNLEAISMDIDNQYNMNNIYIDSKNFKNIKPPNHKLYELNLNNKFIFIRHSISLYNKIAHKEGHENIKFSTELINSNLCEEGIVLAKSIQHIYNKLDIEQIYVSPLVRALETAYYIFENHPKKDKITIIVHPWLTEVAHMIHDFTYDIQIFKKQFNMNSKLKFDWSLFDMYYKSKEDQDLFFLSNIDCLNKDVLYKEINLAYEKYFKDDNKEEIKNFLSHLVYLEGKYNISQLESYKHLFYRTILLKRYLKEQHINKKKEIDKNKKVILIGHTDFAHIATSKLAYNMDEINKLPEDGYHLKNCESLSLII